MENESPESLPRELGIVPFVAVTGRPTEADVRAAVARVDAQGAGAFLVYARSGLEIEYMGEEWLRAVAWFCDEAARRGLRVWLYDEFNWPSGTCRGRVPAENDAWRYAELGVFPAPGGGWAWERALGPPNLLRVTFGADKCGAVEVRAAVRGVRIVLRDYAPSFAVTESGRPVDAGEEAGAGERVLRHDAEPYLFEMDGVPLAPAHPCTALRAGFAPLYRETAPFDLAPGIHRFRIARGAPDDNYFLPALLLAGDFLADGAALRPRTDAPVPLAPLDGLGLGGFVGTATWTARVLVPSGRAVNASLPKETPRTPRTPREDLTPRTPREDLTPRTPREDLTPRTPRENQVAPQVTLRAETGGAPAEAFWNGVSLGVRLRAPFEWPLPSDAACAEGELSIAVSTSVAPMFGPPDAPGAAWDQPFWTPPRDSDARPGLVAVTRTQG